MNFKYCMLYVILFFYAYNGLCAQEKYEIKLCIGRDAEPFCESISKLTLQGFSQYPYLLVLDLDQEMQSIFYWLKAENSAVALLFHEDEIVGCMRGSAQYNRGEKQYYITALVIDEKHRGKHLSKVLIQSLEDFAQSLGYGSCCLKTEQASFHRVLQPDGYKDRDYSFAGYHKYGVAQIKMWPTLQSDGTIMFQGHQLISWKKKLKEERI